MTSGFTIEPGPADMRMLLSFGPFNLLPDFSFRFYFAIITAEYGEEGEPPPSRETTDLISSADLAERLFRER